MLSTQPRSILAPSNKHPQTAPQLGQPHMGSVEPQLSQSLINPRRGTPKNGRLMGVRTKRRRLHIKQELAEEGGGIMVNEGGGRQAVLGSGSGY